VFPCAWTAKKRSLDTSRGRLELAASMEREDKVRRADHQSS
jgi:hypothetical protein